MIFASLVKRVNGKAVLPKIRELQLDTASLRSEWLVFLTKTEGDEIDLQVVNDDNVKRAYQIASGVCDAEIQHDEVLFADLDAIQQEGIQQGMQQGMQEERLQTVKRMKLQNMDINVISIATNLSPGEINNILLQ
jgi:hypothetical protein